MASAGRTFLLREEASVGFRLLADSWMVTDSGLRQRGSQLELNTCLMYVKTTTSATGSNRRFRASTALRLAGDELLPAVDVVGRARERRVGHDVDGERGDVGRFDDTPDRKRGAKLIAAVFEFIAQE